MAPITEESSTFLAGVVSGFLLDLHQETASGLEGRGRVGLRGGVRGLTV